jgi:isopentenyl diphosphate isomerase/L-lactate dehydrogenase-like FMN-dependent dehydrogenase
VTYGLKQHDRRVASRITSVERAQKLARRRVPRPVENYLEGGAGEEVSLRENREAFRSVRFSPRLGVTAGAPCLRTSVLGSEVSMPVLLSPIGFSRMMHRSGDVAGASAAAKAGTIFTVSSMSGHTLEDVRSATPGPLWLQLYFLGGREGARRLATDAGQLGYSAIVVTMDTQIPGDRRRESRYGLSPPLRLDRRTITKMAPFVATRPRWLFDQAREGFQLDLVNARRVGAPGVSDPVEQGLLEWIAEPPMWADLAWIREAFGGDVLVKGVLSPDDARRAVYAGAAGVIVSNHGGRQLDGVAATLRALPDIVAAVGDQVDVLVDGGVRSGADVVKALALGARAAMVGRAWAYGLSAAGQPGVEQVLALLREDIDRTMRLLGVSSVDELDRSVVGLRLDSAAP